MMKPRAKTITAVIACLAGWIPLAQTGCTTPATRSREKQAALLRLSPEDRRLVLSGQVRRGLDQGAVYIAWGAPSEVRPPSATEGPLERWMYVHTYTGVAGGYFGARRGLIYSPASGRYHYDANEFYEASVYLRSFGPPHTDVPYKSALFDHGELVSFESQFTSRQSGESAHSD